MPAQVLAHKEVGSFGFFNLPGEIRNRIYAFATEQGPITYHSDRIKKYFNDEKLRIPKRRPEFFGLTQVCRQIQAEYSPNYAANTNIHVVHLDLEEFIERNKPHMVHNKDEKPAGNLFVDCRQSGNREHENIDLTPFENGPIDILPFIEYLMTGPRLVVKCGINDCVKFCVKETD
jgi:hypothetical protein